MCTCYLLYDMSQGAGDCRSAGHQHVTAYFSTHGFQATVLLLPPPFLNDNFDSIHF